MERVAYEQRQRILREELRMQEARQAAAAQLAEQRALLEGLEAGLHERAAAVECAWGREFIGQRCGQEGVGDMRRLKRRPCSWM